MILVKIDVSDVKQNVKKGPKRSRGPKTDFVGNQNTGRARAETTNAGVTKVSSFVWTLMVKKENGQRKGMGWVNSEGVG